MWRLYPARITTRWLMRSKSARIRSHFWLRSFNEVEGTVRRKVKKTWTNVITARKRSLGQGNVLHPFVCLQGVSVWCHFLSGCLVPCSFWEAFVPGPMILPGGCLRGCLYQDGGLCERCRPPQGMTSSGSHWSGWYASHWTAFLIIQATNNIVKF